MEPHVFPFFDAAEMWLTATTRFIKLLVEGIGISLILLGVVMAVIDLVKERFSAGKIDFNRVRLRFARYLALALEFQLAADLLATTVAPGWTEIGKLAAIATVRTILNYFLEKEIEREEGRSGELEDGVSDPSKPRSQN